MNRLSLKAFRRRIPIYMVVTIAVIFLSTVAVVQVAGLQEKVIAVVLPEADGAYWSILSRNEKLQLINGFLLGNWVTTQWDATVDEDMRGTVYDTFQKYRCYNAFTVVDTLDEFYANKGNREVVIWRAVLSLPIPYIDPTLIQKGVKQ